MTGAADHEAVTPRGTRQEATQACVILELILNEPAVSTGGLFVLLPAERCR
jgi:hypothetical protein